ncbi:MAG: tRNA epoxyqueuosine(34) reductase QueG [Firmicutes bacterium]|nr:tRNA epoxyqueuosine(34) reductase QueG [Bacillota bacterium]
MLREKIEEYCGKNDLAWGVTDAEPFPEIAEALGKCAEDLSGFVCSDLEKRIYPRKTMENAQSIIVIAKSYNKKIAFKQDGIIRCKIALGSFGEDYHGTLRKHLDELKNILAEDSPHGEFIFYVDTGPLDDRAVARRAGLGNFGKNGMLITEKYGSAVNIGYIITNLEIPKDEPFERDLCKGCRKCIDACPHGALREDGYDFRKCISYISQKKGELEDWEKEILGNTLYGCDLCLRACIYNDKYIGEVTDIDEMYPAAESILALSNKQFKVKYGETGIGWRGLKIMKRNARNALEKGMIY